MTSKTGIQPIDILPDITKSKENETMKFGQLVEYNVRNIFRQISCKKIKQGN